MNRDKHATASNIATAPTEFRTPRRPGPAPLISRGLRKFPAPAQKFFQATFTALSSSTSRPDIHSPSAAADHLNPNQNPVHLPLPAIQSKTPEQPRHSPRPNANLSHANPRSTPFRPQLIDRPTIDPDRPQTVEPQDQSTSDRFLKREHKNPSFHRVSSKNARITIRETNVSYEETN
jgi:hypothetical protein